MVKCMNFPTYHFLLHACVWLTGLLPLPLIAQTLTIAGPQVPGMAMPAHNAEHESRGIVVEGLQLLKPWMGATTLRFQMANLPRLEESLKEGREQCVTGMFATPERDRIGYFVPFLMTPPLQLVVREDLVPRLPMHGNEVQLEALLADRSLRGVLAEQRPYPGPLQGRLLAALDAGVIKRQAGGTAGTGQTLLLMISHARADYTFEYPSIVLGMAEDPLLKAPLVSVLIQGNEALQVSAIYCPRTPWGLAMAQQLEHAVQALMAEPDTLLKLYARWLPGNVFERYQADLRRAFEYRAAHPVLVL